MPPKKWSWNDESRERLDQVYAVLDEFEEFLPLTLRQIYYRLVAQRRVENSRAAFGAVASICKHARVEGLISWADIDDRPGGFYDLSGCYDTRVFVEESLKALMSGYYRNLMQTQDAYLELWVDAPSMRTFFSAIARRYSVSMALCGGFSSVSFLNDFMNRAFDAVREGRRPVILFFGSYAPGGTDLLESMKATFAKEESLSNISFKRIALGRDDVTRHRLPANPDAIRGAANGGRRRAARFGELPVELDALPPDLLERMIREAIEAEIDLALFRSEQERQRADRETIERLRARISGFLDNNVSLVTAAEIEYIPAKNGK